MANRNSWKEYSDLMIGEMKGAPVSQPKKQPPAKVSKSLGRELTKAVQGAIASAPKQQNPAKAQMQLNPQGEKLKGWGRALK